MKTVISVFLIFLFLQGCASSPIKQFEKIKVGMEKGSVLELVGSPQYTQRSQGQDRWTYSFYQNDVRLDKEVHFDQGVVVYVGEVLKPVLSAEEQDRINRDLQKKLENRGK